MEIFMIKRCRFFVTICLMFPAASVLSAQSFNSKLSKDDRSLLAEGKVLIRNIDYSSNMSLESANPGAVKLKDAVKALHPSYLAEIIQMRPYAGNENLPERLQQTLLAIPEYAGIPYYSEHGGTYYDLYSSAEIISDTLSEDGKTHQIQADLNMEPFGVVHTPITLETDEKYVYYIQSNSNDLWYFDKFKCVDKKKLKCAIVLFRDGDNWVLYGAGGVNALRIPFFDKRIETSFINRIKTFCNYIFEKI
jgi:hypothetical protein